jgi:cell fate (sporulation/competence/biofilm development) regulator YlbF (YheA/YmcA/DUF963 family)
LEGEEFMNVYDKAHELAKALSLCPEVIEFRNASKKIKGNGTNKKMLEDFRKLQIEAYTQQMQGGQMSKELSEKLQNLGSVISLNPDVSVYLQAEARFGVIWEDIMKILNESIDIDFNIGIDNNK